MDKGNNHIRRVKNLKKYKQEEMSKEDYIESIRSSVVSSSYASSSLVSRQSERPSQRKSATTSSYCTEDEAYAEFMRLFGHIDFSLVSFLPTIKSDEEIEQQQKMKLRKKKTGRMMQKLVH